VTGPACVRARSAGARVAPHRTGKKEIVHEPFRCLGCGAGSSAATICGQCGATAFELARPPARSDADAEEVAELVSLQAAREERRRPPQVHDH
jgi:hypothetical protein